MVLGMEAVKQGIGDGFISCGNTGALLAGATFITGRIKNVDRASLSTISLTPGISTYGIRSLKGFGKRVSPLALSVLYLRK